MTRAMTALFPLDGRVQQYAWGSTDALPGFLGRHPDGHPWAEWWLGAHPAAPSPVGSVPATTLDRLVARDPGLMVGPAVRDRFGPRLPFLLKVLAVEEPLSLQVHPTVAQAQSGYRAERPAGGTPPDDPLYTDEWAKPEMVLALTRFNAFSGLRPPVGALARLDALGGRALAPIADRLRRDLTHDGLGRVVADLLSLSGDARSQVVDDVQAGIQRLAHVEAPESVKLAVIDDLARRYPDDPAVVVAVLMNHVVLEPGEAMAVPAGLLHCYSAGLAAEIQSTSDNTLRAGLTAKKVDVGEVLRVIDPAAQPQIVWPTHPAPGLETFHAGVDDFALDRLCATTGGEFLLAGGTPAIVLGMDGRLTLSSSSDHTQAVVHRGQAVFVPAALGQVTVSGLGEAIRARPGLAEGSGMLHGDRR